MICALGEHAPEFEGGGHFIADNATIIGSVRLKDRASVWYNAVLRGDNDWLTIGACSNVQDGAVLHTDPGIELVVGNGVTIGHKVMLHGCTIGDNSLIGIGTTVLNNATIGNNCIVGAHALVTENKTFPDGSLILGSPAKVVRSLSDEEITQIGWSADVYVKNAARFKTELEPIPDLSGSNAS
ncbi:MAG: gamma carbonic anhydrase family protein [Woeseiaceae bacterium]|nr:gamma carbonic anhydrase family protein [Woeseiaceae bacterium]